MKRALDQTREEETTAKAHPAKRLCAAKEDYISTLSDELLLHVLSFVPISTLNICQRVSHRFSTIAGDRQLWKVAYYDRFVRPRAARIPGASSRTLSYSSKRSRWLDEEKLVIGGAQTDWKRQYRLRHNWSRGKCAVSELPIAERPSVPPLLVRMKDGIIFTVDAIAGLRAWSSKERRELVVSIRLSEPGSDKPALPTSLAVDMSMTVGKEQNVAVGFGDGSFRIYTLRTDGNKRFELVYRHPASSNGMLYALAFSWPYLLSISADQLLSLYVFPSLGDPPDNLEPPRLLTSLKSYVVRQPLSLTIRTTSKWVTASIAYAFETYTSGWTVGIQEMCLSSSGELVESRLSTAEDTYDSSFPCPASPSHSSFPPWPGGWNHVTAPAFTKPTSLSYSHPYLLASHPDNTLTLYLVKSTSSSLAISPGSRLWGHTSSVSGAHVGDRGKAVSISHRGDELRVWELEGGFHSARAQKRLLSEELSIRIRPEEGMSTCALEAMAGSVAQADLGRGLGSKQGLEDMSVTPGLVGFDEENVVVLREKSQGTQALVVYDFT